LEAAGTAFGVRDWTDEKGTVWPVKLCGAPYGNSDEIFNMFALKDKDGLTIHRYWRYKPPKIRVDDVILEEPLLEGDEVAPDKIDKFGTADVMIESFIRGYMGIDIHQVVLGWSQRNHDDYVIYDWTITNTGNIDRDDTIELPNQTLKDFYIMREAAPFPASDRRNKEWSAWYGCRPGEDLRIMYNYPHRTKGAAFDDFGDIDGALTTQGFIKGPCYEGEAMLHVDKSPTDHTNNQVQPQMHSVWNYRILALKLGDETRSPAELQYVYDVMKYGLPYYQGTPYMVGAYPGTYHEKSPDEQGYKYVNDFPGWGMGWHTIEFNSSGPYTLKFGESIRFVYAQLWGSISLRQSWDLGKAWKSGKLQPPPGCVFGVTDNMPPQYKLYPSLYAQDVWSTEYNNWAKDCWIFTGKDSLFQNASNAQWNLRQNYKIPIAPPPPSIAVNSRPDKVDISWGTESESAADLAGYRVYRAIPTVDSTFFYKIFECGKGTHSYEDRTAQRGIGYTYFVTAFDDGVGNIPDVNGKKESLESGQYLNMTTRSTYLTRPAGTLSKARVVPNPYHISAIDVQFTGEPNKIMFMNIPPICTIKIFSESGDLVKTIEHTSGSGDERWGALIEQHSITDSDQLIVSGIYIAHIETPIGESVNLKFVVIR
jgi:hypothetical protein